MDPYFERVYRREIASECQHALRAAQAIDASLARGLDVPVLFYHLHSFIAHVAAVSRILWPPLKGDAAARARAQARGTDLCSVLGVDNSHPVASRDLRNHLEHYDERLDSWVQESTHHNLAVDIVGPAGVFGGPAMTSQDVFRQFDPAAKSFLFRGEVFPLQPAVSGLEDLLARLQERARQVGEP
jgi:hypothetical protein